jgi:hypothetical protein
MGTITNNVLKKASDYEEKYTSLVSEKYYKANNYIGIALNIAVPAALLFVFKIKLAYFFLAFIAFDALQIGLNQLSYKVYNVSLKTAWNMQKEKFLDKICEMTPKEIEDYKNEMDSSQKFYQEKLSLINDKISEYKSFSTIGTLEAKKQDITFVEEMNYKFQSYDNIKWIRKRLKNISKISERIIALLKEDADSIDIVIHTYNVYSEELMNIIKKYEDMDDEQKERYEPKIQELMDLFESHLEELEEKITSQREHSIDFDIDFLSKKLKEESDKNTD